MQYMLLICVNGQTDLDRPELTADEQPGDIEAWLKMTADRGARLLGNQLSPPSAATTVRVRKGGETLLTDGPYAETKEQIAGFDIIECANLDEAIEIAAAHPVAKFGMVEVRPFFTED